jgi:hypothetical protein
MGRPWTDEEDNMTNFRLKDLEAFLFRNKYVSLTSAKIALRLRSINGSPTSMNIKGRTVRLWKIPAFEKQDAAFNVQIEQRETPF